MSSHREAPRISKDPVADSTDLYAFVDPNDPKKVTILANFIPFEDPAGGPNFFMFGDDVLYEIKIDNDGDAEADIAFQFHFKTRVMNPNTFLYNTGPITSLTDANWNVRQLYSVTMAHGSWLGQKRTVLGSDLASPPVNIGPRSTPGYEALANAAVRDLGDGVRVFAGQREDAFNVDLGSIFDLGALRPFGGAHLIPLAAPGGVDGTRGFNVHTIALQVPKTMLTRDGSGPVDIVDGRSTIGVWATASRHKTVGMEQVSRLGNPLINEVVIPIGKKDEWNARDPHGDEAFLSHYEHPELQTLLPVLYPGVFPNLAAATKAGIARADLVAILLTGLPTSVLKAQGVTFQNFTGARQADMLRLNLAIPPTPQPNPFGIIGGDLAGFPNGRRIVDNVTAIELRAIAGVTLPLVNGSFVPDAAAGALTDGTANEMAPMATFPYLAHPLQGYEHAH